MSDTEELFLGSDVSVAGTANILVDVLGTAVAGHEPDTFHIGAMNFAGLPGATGATLTSNYQSAVDLYPDEPTAFDHCSVILSIWRPDRDPDLQAKAARWAMERVVESLRWPAVLLHNVDVLVASWSPASDWRAYPPGVSPNVEDREHWA